jgi:Na+/melibiose symporter-like transporter
MRMKAYQKLTLITVILGLILPLFGLFLYFFVNSLIGIPLLGLVFGGALLIAILIIIINVAGLVAAFKIKNTRIAGILLMGCGAALFLVIHFFAIPGLVLFVISGILALRERNSTIKKI